MKFLDRKLQVAYKSRHVFRWVSAVFDFWGIFLVQVG